LPANASRSGVNGFATAAEASGTDDDDINAILFTFRRWRNGFATLADATMLLWNVFASNVDRMPAHVSL
jgi:hypothetical protein